MDQEQQKNRESKIFVWWDIQSCVVPSGYDALRVSRAIKAAMNNLGFLATGIRFLPVDLEVDICNQHMIYSSIKRKISHPFSLPPGSVVVVISCDRVCAH
ncbi:hypothetical protein Bca4012_008747 [Brassica carinata]|uniref:NYN domain-containing protein n=1 Tax=Brassica carinata TaxID=52824 RepID=A0A8X7U017_BRACI|nr:hypothetical protein Bca52824_079363 [Brassica carinata]